MKKSLATTINLLTSLKGIIGVISISTYTMSHEKIAFWILVGGAVIDEIIKFLNKENQL